MTRGVIENKVEFSTIELEEEESMRKVIFGGAISLDNFIAREDGAVDWLLWSKEVNQIMKDMWKPIDTVVMGRKTYEVAQRMGGDVSQPGVKTYVFSRTIKKPNSKKLTFVADDAAAFVRTLKEADEGKDIYVMGGGVLAKSLFEADLIDEIGFNIQPVLLGSGIPLFHQMSRQIDLELKEGRQLSKGCVYVTYKVKHV
jgi:dihydrofolate reductase